MVLRRGDHRGQYRVFSPEPKQVASENKSRKGVRVVQREGHLLFVSAGIADGDGLPQHGGGWQRETTE